MNDGTEELTHGLWDGLVQPGEDEEGQLRDQQAPVTVILCYAPQLGSVVNLELFSFNFIHYKVLQS